MKTIVSAIMLLSLIIGEISGYANYGFIISVMLINILLWMPED